MRWLRRLFHKSAEENQIDKELRFHLEQQIKDYVASGISPQEATRRAKLEFGGLDRVKEEIRDTRTARILDDLIQDVLYGLRLLRRSPGFTAVAILTLALGIGANTAIFSIVDAVLIRPLPIRDPQKVVVLHNRFPWSLPRTSVSALQFSEFSRRGDLFEAPVAMQEVDFNLTGRNPSLRLQAMQVTSGLFSTLGVDPEIGRRFSAADNVYEGMQVTRRGVGGSGRHVAILSHKLWEQLFKNDRGAIGKTIHLDGLSYEIVGVLPEKLEILYPQTDLWVPAAFSPEQLSESHRWYVGYTMLARLHPDETLTQTRAGVTNALLNNEDMKAGIEVRSLIDEEVGEVRAPLKILLVSVGFILLIACANIANLLLARNGARSTELAIRSALGAPRRRIVSQLVTESLLLSILGAILGLLFAQTCVSAISRMAMANSPYAATIRLSSDVLVFTIVVSVVGTLIFGLIPALLSSRADLSSILNGCCCTGGSGRGHRKLRSILAISEVALALTLLVASGLLLRSFVKLLEVHPGFESQNVLTMKLSMSQAMRSDPTQLAAFSNALLARVLALPGILHAAISTGIPFAPPGYSTTFEIRDWHSAPGAPIPHADTMYVTPDYFEAMRIPLIRGRLYNAGEMRPGNAAGNGAVRVIDETLAKSLWPGSDPIGAEIGNFGKWARIIGVVGAVHDSDLSADAKGTIYVPGYGGTTLIVRSASAPKTLVRAIREQVSAVDPEIPIYDTSTMSDLIATSLQRRRFSAILIGVFASLALLLALIGLYGVIAQLVMQRTREIGIRIALGARRRDVLGLILSQGLGIALSGVALGLVCSVLMKSLIASELFGIGPLDVRTLVSVSILLIIVALVASYFPARRATRIDPVIALRYE